MKLMDDALFYYLSACHIFGIVVFMYGFLPVPDKSRDFADRQTSLPDDLYGIPLNTSELYGRKVDRLVLIVIDALRADFILGDHLQQSMPYLAQLHHDSQACSYLARAHTPTVTLPRIKALVTGGIPGFADVILNIGSTEIEEDSIIHQLDTSGHRMVFYGDDTWLRLFPGKFLRNDGTTSFFVSDYTEVDLNVTRHLNFELNQTDWSVMILHYLGLDHIGHTSGPRSALVPVKLKEMDDVIKKIHSKMKHINSAIVIAGDHGMSDSGSHGGSSQAEVEIPLTFVMNGCRPDNQTNLQIDLAPTIASLMGIPLPSNNLGSLLPGILMGFQPKERLYTAFVNARNIARQFEKNADPNPDYQRAVKLYQDWLTGTGTATEDTIVRLFLQSTAEMSARLIENLVNYDLYPMFVGLLLTGQALWIVVLECKSFVNCRSIRPALLSMGLYITLFVSILVHIGICLSIGNKSQLCLNRSDALIPTLGVNLIILALLAVNWQMMYSRSTFSFKKLGNIPETFLVVASFLHSFSLASSSFVEEEHQTYYFFSSTLFLLLLYNGPKKWGTALRVLGSMGLLRIARTWNQTGDRWINEPDVEEWLNHPDNRFYLTMSSIVGVLGIFHWIRSTQRLNALQSASTAVGLLGILAHRAAYGVFSFNYPASMGIAEAALTYSSLVVVVITSQKNRSSAMVTVWIVLTSLLKRTHNLFLTWMQLVQYSLVQPLLASQLRPFFYGLAHYCVGMAWYFQQGNGNNLARIDLQSGYVGLPSYNPVAVGFLLSSATFAGPVLSLLLAVQRSPKDRGSLLYGFLYSRAVVVPLFLVVVTILRYHLFVWTVFSPKLLYEGATSCAVLFSLGIASTLACRNKKD